MAKKTIALIGILALIVVGLLVLALRSQQPEQKQTKTTAPTTGVPTVTSVPGTAVLSFTPSVLQVAAGSTGSVNVTVDSVDNGITAVQLDLSFNPNILSNVVVTKGTFFKNSVEMLNSVDQNNGKISYAAGASFSESGVRGTGTVATITFQVLPTVTPQTEIVFTKKTLVTAEKSIDSVLKTTNNVVIQITNSKPQTSTNSATQ